MKRSKESLSLAVRHLFRKRWTRALVVSFAAVVVFVTTYLLILPALTLDKEEAEQQGGITVATDPEYKSGELTYDGKSFNVEASFDEKAKIPSAAEIVVEEIKTDSNDYAAYYNKALEAVQEDAGKNKVSDLEFAKFYDIALRSDGEEVEPADTVDVSISYDKGIAAANADHVRVIHFKEDPKSDKVETEILKSDDVDVTIEKDKMTEASFKADSFSVYAVVYTVDFEYEVDGTEYNYELDGEGAVSLKELLKELHVTDDVDAFASEIDDVKFSDPSLVAILKVSKTASLGRLKAANHVSQDYAAWREQGEVEKRNAKRFEAGDWAIVSLKPFDTKENLSIYLANGEVLRLVVTDDQDAPMNPDGNTVQTISNPAGTTIDLFDYWISDHLKDATGRAAWPGYYDGWYYNDDNEYAWYKAGTLLGSGNDAGINAGHYFKFNPAWAGTVYEGTIPNKETEGQLSPTRNPTNVSYANDGDRLYYAAGVNSYTGNGDPRQGLVQDTLVNGYPKLSNNATLGTDDESLEYLFKVEEQAPYKDSYPGVNSLLYVDKDGYYTYDSRDYWADFDESSKTFTLTEQTSSDTEVRGFWPFGQQKFWLGMHMNTQFSMPANGQVLNPKQEYKDMQFEFSGDDDTWLYVDGVLVGDGGGVHNRTEIDINFATGKVTVTGKKDANHTGTFEETKWLDDIFKDAGKYNAADWEDIPGEEGLDTEGNRHKRFKAGTYHTFDMFYLERGGGESNLYIHYNLVSTADFTAHKSYEGFADDERMQRDQFKFELIGLDGQYQSVYDPSTQTATITKLNDDGPAIMPTSGTPEGQGTVADPKKVHSETAWIDSQGNELSGTVYTTGVTEDGNVNFGQAQISEQEMHNCDEGHPSLYRYVIREIVPNDAVNQDGKRWDEATDVEKAAGGFVKDQIRYDGTIYYMTARVTSWDQTGSDGTTYKAYGLSKTYYTDDTFSTEKSDVNFISFENRYAPDEGEVEFTKVDGINMPLAGAEFTLYNDQACTKVAKDLDGVDQVIVSGADGKVLFDKMAAPRTYYMKETAAPAGYRKSDYVYQVSIASKKDTSGSSVITIVGDETATPVTSIVNPRYSVEGLEVYKYWKGGRPSDETTITYKLYQSSSQSKIGTYYVDVSELGYGRPDWNTGRLFLNEELTGQKTAIKKGSVIEVAITTTSNGWDWDTLDETTQITSNQTILSDELVPVGSNKQRIIRIRVDNESSEMISLFGQLQSCYDGNGGKPRIEASIVTEPDDSEPGDTKLVGTVVLGKSNVSATVEDEFANIVTVEPGNDDWTSVIKNLPDQSIEGEWLIKYAYTVEEVASSIPLGYALENIIPGSGVNGDSIGIVNAKEVPETINVDIKKTDDTPDSTNYLEGAVFALEYRADSEDEWTALSNEDVPELDEQGHFTVPGSEEGIKLTGLTDGQYRLHEVSAPEGYVIINADPVEFTVLGGEIIDRVLTEGVRYQASTESTDAAFTIPNTPGAVLPNAGGIGTIFYRIIGILLITAAGIWMMCRRKSRA